jgi:ABC-type bacteriocin/lantibiotic exporter with double-glycine peptidase domain
MERLWHCPAPKKQQQIHAHVTGHVLSVSPAALLLWCCCPCRYGAVLVLQGAMTLGDLNAFMLYAIYVAGSAGGLAGTAAQVIAAVRTRHVPT